MSIYSVVYKVDNRHFEKLVGTPETNITNTTITIFATIIFNNISEFLKILISSLVANLSATPSYFINIVILPPLF